MTRPDQLTRTQLDHELAVRRQVIAAAQTVITETEAELVPLERERAYRDWREAHDERMPRLVTCKSATH